MADAAVEFLALARALTEAGETGLKRELYQALNDAADPLSADIRSVYHLRDYMPSRYAAILAVDLRVNVHRRTTGTEPGVTLVGTAPTVGRGGRKVAQRESGVITHPVFATGPRRSWRWKVQTDGMRPGFFSDPVEQAGPQVREQIVAALRRVRDKIYGAR